MEAILSPVEYHTSHAASRVTTRARITQTLVSSIKVSSLLDLDSSEPDLEETRGWTPTRDGTPTC